MYDKKLRELFSQSKEHARKALENGDTAAAASYYEQCGDILSEQAKNSRGKVRKRRKELADKFYELSDNIVGRSTSLEAQTNTTQDRSDGSAQDDAPPVAAERFIQKTVVTWDDVAGLEETKKAIKQSFALSAIENKPPAVEGMHSLLLYGPPGTGKSLLASAVAGSNNYTFFNVKISSALSKYYGESGKILSTIFDAARKNAPSVLFFDEIDAVAMSRGGDLDEASRRVLSTLLTELSGMDAENDDVLVITATNAPWDLDPAILSRMEQAVHVPLPDKVTAERIIALNTTEQGVAVDVSVDEIAERCVTQRYSGREVKNVCKEAVRKMIERLNPDLEHLSERPIAEIEEYELQTGAVTGEDFEEAFEQVTPETDERLQQRYIDWSV